MSVQGHSEIVKVVAEVTDQVWLPAKILVKNSPCWLEDDIPWLITVGVGQ